MARYGKAFKAKAVARLLPPESATLEAVSTEFGVSIPTLERWRSQALAESGERTWTGPARLEAVIHTASLDEQARNAWCREHGVFPQDLERWRAQAMDSLNDDASEQVSREQVRADRKRIKTLERELKHKEKALAETAALLVLSKKLSAIFREGGEE